MSAWRLFKLVEEVSKIMNLSEKRLVKRDDAILKIIETCNKSFAGGEVNGELIAQEMEKSSISKGSFDDKGNVE